MITMANTNSSLALCELRAKSDINAMYTTASFFCFIFQFLIEIHKMLFIEKCLHRGSRQRMSCAAAVVCYSRTIEHECAFFAE